MYLIKLANRCVILRTPGAVCAFADRHAYRNIKVLLSIGGWTYSQDGHFNFVTDATSRATFVSNAVSFVENFGLDGVDIDFEYPDSDDLASGFASLLTELRSAFDTLQQQKGDATPYEITVRKIAKALVETYS